MPHPLAILCVGLLLQAPKADLGTNPGEALRRDRAAILAAEARELKAVADGLRQSSKPDVAGLVERAIEVAPTSGPTRFVPLPEVVARDQAAGRPNLPRDAQEIRLKSSKSLFELAKRAGSPAVKRFALADRLLRDVLARAPEHAEARRLIGYLPFRNGWATPHAKELIEEKGMVPHPVFGWVLADWPEHLDRGDLPSRFDARGRAIEWKPSAEVDAQHATWDTAWKINSAPHFSIQTDVPLSEAIIFVRRLEDLYQLFFAEFADLIGSEHLPMAARFRNPRQQPVATPIKLQVAYFAGKTEYVAYFRSRFGKDESVSLGYYMPPSEARLKSEKPCSYFFKDLENPIKVLETLNHEVSHQILFESAGKVVDYQWKLPNYWVWEGLGTYFESLTQQPDGSILIGALSGPRVAEARSQILVQNRYVPLAKLSAMDKEAFQEPANNAVYRHYAEAMVLTIFFLNGEDGKYREAYLDFVASAYRRRPGSKALAERLKIPFGTLDTEFKAFLKP